MASLLLGTKTHLPQSRQDWVHRARLLSEMDQAAQNQRVILLSSAAGSGKSTLVSDWAAQAARKAPHEEGARVVAWLGLDAQDNDPALFWAYCIAAFQRHFAGFGAAIQAELLSPQPPPVDLFLPDLINQIADLPGSLALVLDDYHLIDQPTIHESLAFLVEHAPENLLLIFATRTDPPVPLSRWRARGYLAEIRVEALRFQVDEAAEFLNRYMGLRLDESDVDRLASRTEGWAAGLQLAALSMQGKPDPKTFISKFSASHQYILDYLTSEVLSQQPADIQDFLVHTSILDQLNASLCNAVVEVENSAEILDQLDRQNLFVISMDDERKAYRYHHLFAELLQIRFSRLDKVSAAGFHRRAAGWFDAEGDVDEALRHALAAGDSAYAADIVARNWKRPAEAGYLKTAQKWLGALPPDVLKANPLLSAAAGVVLSLTGDTGAALTYAKMVDQALSDRQLVDAVPDDALTSLAASLRSLLAIRLGNANADEITTWAQQAIEHSSPQDFFIRGAANMTLSAGYRRQGRIEEAIEALRSSLEQPNPANQIMIGELSRYYLGRMYLAQGRLRQANDLFETALAHLEKRGDQVEGMLTPGVSTLGVSTSRGIFTPSAASLLLGLSQVRYEQNRLDQAEELLLAYRELNRKGGSHDLRKHSLVLRAQICLARQDFPAALALVTEELLPISGRDDSFNSPALAFQAYMQARCGQLEAAQRWAESMHIPETGHPGFGGMTILLYLVRVDLMLQKPGDALGLLAHLKAAADASRSRGWQMEILLLQALGYAQQGDTERALAALSESLALGEPDGYIRLFLDEGEPLRRLLQFMVEPTHAHPNWNAAYARRLLAAGLHGIEPASAAENARLNAVALEAQSAKNMLVEPLSQRELEVLQLLAQGLPNSEIANRLYISLATVKTHLIHVFGKLSVQNRVEAVNRAKSLGLI